MSLNEQNENEEFSLADASDAAILMHRDAHFGGQFEIMQNYYDKEGKGVCSDFDAKRISELAALEKEMNQNLSGIILSGADAERVAEAKEAYKKLRDLYDEDKPFNKIPLLLADLILSEDEDPREEIAAIIKEKGLAVSALIELIRSENFYDPLFPGYGQAPGLALKCLGLIKDKRAIIALFESIGTGDFFDEDVALDALHAIGDPAKEFLLRVLKGKPWTGDNEKAALALIAFKEDQTVSSTALKMLMDPDVCAHISLATYLILICEGLTDKKSREAFTALLDHPSTPKELKQDIKIIAKLWQ